MKTNRREFLGLGGTVIVGTFFPSVAMGNTTDKWHPHPHVASYTPAHALKRLGVEHSFLRKESSKYAGMKGCWVVVEHGDSINSDALEQMAGFEEHVPFFVHPENPVTNLSHDEIGAILVGEIRNWREVGGVDQEINLSAHGGFRRWQRAFGLMVCRNFLDDSDDTIDRVMRSIDTTSSIVRGVEAIRLSWQPGYDAVTEFVKKEPGALGVGIRPAYASGLIPLSVDGTDVLSPSYGIHVSSFLNFRRDSEKARPLAEIALHGMVGKYETDIGALKEVLG